MDALFAFCCGDDFFFFIIIDIFKSSTPRLIENSTLFWLQKIDIFTRLMMLMAFKCVAKKKKSKQ